jgi:phenylacetate-CoA ligase
MLGRVGLRLVDRFRKSDALTLYREYLRTERASRAEVEERQRESLGRLLRHASAHVPYYRETCAALPIRFADEQPGVYLRALPVMTKAVMRAEPNRFTADDSARFQPTIRTSSGTTGEPFRFLMSRASRSSQWACIYRQWHVGGWEPGDRIAWLGGTSISPSTHAIMRWAYGQLNNWLTLSAFEMSPANMDRWLQQIQDQRIRFMHAYPSSAMVLAEHVIARGMTPRLASITTSAELLHSHQREVIERAFSCPVNDLYGANDGGAFAYQCERREGFHVVAERAVVEILRPDGTPAGPGESGRIVSTDLTNYAMPFIRYETGDEAAWATEPCPCGRGLPLLQSIFGRANDYLTTLTGEKVHSGFFTYTVRSLRWIEQFQAVQESASRLRVYVRPRSGVNPDHLDHLASILAQKFQGMDIGIQIVDSIPLSRAGKLRFVVNKTIEGAPTQ